MGIRVWRLRRAWSRRMRASGHSAVRWTRAAPRWTGAGEWHRGTCGKCGEYVEVKLREHYSEHGTQSPLARCRGKRGSR